MKSKSKDVHLNILKDADGFLEELDDCMKVYEVDEEYSKNNGKKYLEQINQPLVESFEKTVSRTSTFGGNTSTTIVLKNKTQVEIEEVMRLFKLI